MKRSRHLGRLAAQFIFNGGGEEQGVGVLRHIGGAGLGVNGAALRAKHPGDQLEKRGLSGPIAPHQRRDLAAAQADGQTSYRWHGAVAMLELLDATADRPW